MNIRDLNYLAALAKHRHFGRAARACHVSQPTLSTQIKKLEDTLGNPLLERGRRDVLLTPLGEAVLQKAQEILNNVEDIRTLGATFADPMVGDLKLGVIPTIAPYFLPHFLEKMTQNFPQTKLKIYELKTPDILTKLQDGSLDAGFMALPVPGDSLKTYPLLEEPFLLAVPQGHPLSKASKISTQGLKSQNLLLLEDGHCFRNQALDVCTTAGGAEDENFKATSLETLKNLVKAGLGITLVPQKAATPTNGITYLPFSGKAPMRTVGFVCRYSSPKKTLLEKITKIY